jgi:transposase InsO family protein
VARRLGRLGHLGHLDVKKVGRHGIHRVVRGATDNGANYRAAVFERALIPSASRHQRTRPHAPRHNDKAERYQRILAEELLYASQWSPEAERARAVGVWNVRYNYHRPHTAAAGNRPPASRLTPHAST